MGKHFVRRHTREQLPRGFKNKNPHPSQKQEGGRLTIGFASMSAGAGATTLAFAAAEYLASNAKNQAPEYGKPGAVTLLELDPRPDAPAGTPYDKTGIDRRFAGRDYISLYALASQGKPLQGVRNIHGGVGWALRLPGEPVPNPCDRTLLRLLNNVDGETIVCDIAAYAIGNDTLSALLADLSHLFCVFDPLPSRLLASVQTAEACRAASEAGVPTTCIINKLNDGVNLRETLRFTGIRDYISIPAIPHETVYAAEYACRSLAPELLSSLEAIFSRTM